MVRRCVRHLAIVFQTVLAADNFLTNALAKCEPYLDCRLTVRYPFPKRQVRYLPEACVNDRYESEYARFLSSNFKKKPRLISGIFNESLQQCQFRLWDRKGKSFEPIKSERSWFKTAEFVS